MPFGVIMGALDAARGDPVMEGLQQPADFLLAGARVQMSVYKPADKLLLTVDPLISASKARPHIKHTITLLDPAAGRFSLQLVTESTTEHFAVDLDNVCKHYSLESEVRLRLQSQITVSTLSGSVFGTEVHCMQDLIAANQSAALAGPLQRHIPRMRCMLSKTQCNNIISINLAVLIFGNTARVCLCCR